MDKNLNIYLKVYKESFDINEINKIANLMYYMSTIYILLLYLN
uniref:Uncharacterized protein n=1 Tax=Clostridium perfringens TaxID=1502 RepID=A0A4Y5T3P6_CLOPF|nr:hypothetical protein [Clostridium perfringens]